MLYYELLNLFFSLVITFIGKVGEKMPISLTISELSANQLISRVEESLVIS